MFSDLALLIFWASVIMFMLMPKAVVGMIVDVYTMFSLCFSDEQPEWKPEPKPELGEIRKLPAISRDEMLSLAAKRAWRLLELRDTTPPPSSRPTCGSDCSDCEAKMTCPKSAAPPISMNLSRCGEHVYLWFVPLNNRGYEMLEQSTLETMLDPRLNFTQSARNSILCVEETESD